MHIVVRSEAHDSGLCAAPPERKREFARDIRNLTLLALHLNRNLKGAKDAADWTLDENRCWFAATTMPRQVSAETEMPAEGIEGPAGKLGAFGVGVWTV